MATIAQVKRALMARVDGLGALEVAVTGPFQVTLRVTPVPGIGQEELTKGIREALEYVRPLGYRYEIIYDTGVNLPDPPSLEGRFSLATIDVDFRRDGLREGLLKLVPSLSRLVVEENSSGPVGERRITVHVGADDSSTMPKVLSDTRKAVTAIGFAGLRYEVAPLDKNDRRNDLVNCGILVPRREQRLDRFTEEDEEVFAGRIKRLVAGKSDPVPLVDNFDGSSVLWGVQFQGGPAPLSCFLPLYDRALVMMPPSASVDDADYFQQNFGMGRADFLTYCKHGKIVPIFKFAMGNFPDEVVRPILENPALPFMSPRELDYLAARYAWNDYGVIKALREHPEATRLLFRALKHARKMSEGVDEHAIRVTEDLIRALLAFSERFEGLMWRQGHIQLANFTPAMLSVRAAHVHTDGDNSARAFTFFTDIMSSAAQLALAQSMRASLHPGMILNERLLGLVAAQFQSSPTYIPKGEAELLPAVLTALDLAYNDTISPEEYVDVFDQSETRRIRQLVADVLKSGSDLAKEQEVRERVRWFNEGVQRLRSKALELADVGVLGHTANGVDAASGTKAIGGMLDGFFGLGLLSRAGAHAFEEVIEHTTIGDKLDRVRGTINRVPAQSIRLYRIRRKLGRIAGRVDVSARPPTGTSNSPGAATYVVNIMESVIGAVAVGEQAQAEGTAGVPAPTAERHDSGPQKDGS